MNNLIYYFSGTGNSLKIAKDLAKELDDAQVIDISEVINDQSKVAAKTVGIVFPVYMWGLPLIVARFVEALDVDQNTYIYSLVNYGGFPANAAGQLKKILTKKGLTLSAAWKVRMPGNYTPMYGAYSREKQQRIFKKAKEKVSIIAPIVKEMKKGPIEKNFFLLNWLFSGLFYNLSSGQIPKMSKEFWVTDKCNSCAVCVQVCPVENIEMKEGKPVWAEKCEQCLACLQWCPQQAIEFGKNTAGRKRYRHPDIKLSEFTR